MPAENFKSRYLDICNKVKRDINPEKISILNDVDFELAFIHRDEINVTYIIGLLLAAMQLPHDKRAERTKEISDLMATEVQLRSKRELIEQFIESNPPEFVGQIDAGDVHEAFDQFWNAQREQAIETLCTDEHIKPAAFHEILQQYVFVQRLPRDQEIVDGRCARVCTAHFGAKKHRPAYCCQN